MEDLEMEMPPLKQVSTGRLIAHLDRSWDQRDEVRKHIRSRLPALQDRARLTQRLLADALATRPPLTDGD
jgi:hypothetical protein